MILDQSQNKNQHDDNDISLNHQAIDEYDKYDQDDKYLYDHLILYEDDAVREEGEENGDDAHESPEFQVGHF